MGDVWVFDDDCDVGANYKLASARAWARRWKALARRQRDTLLGAYSVLRARRQFIDGAEAALAASRAEVERLRAYYTEAVALRDGELRAIDAEVERLRAALAERVLVCGDCHDLRRLTDGRSVSCSRCKPARRALAITREDGRE